MSIVPATRHSPARWVLGLELLGLFVLAGWLTLTAVRIVHEGSRQELHPADAIVVFGAAEYSGHPSPVLRARLDHGFDLFQQPEVLPPIRASAKAEWGAITSSTVAFQNEI
jgi:hypothetical protein